MNLGFLLLELPEGFGGLLGLLELLTMFLLSAGAVRSNTLRVFSTFTDDIRGKRADIVKVAAGGIRLELRIDCLVSNLESKNYLPQFPFRCERIQLGAVFQLNN